MSAPLRTGSRIGAETFEFYFDGRAYAAQRGDTAASALAAAGVCLLGRSIKYRRPRGLLACGPEEPNALLTVGDAPHGIPNVPAPVVRVQPGMRLYSQNRWPSLRVDVASLLRLGAGFWGAGFYYKTFMWPSWRFYEGLIRRLAGLGAAPGASNLPQTKVVHQAADIIVAGAGAAGVRAALDAARNGRRVILCEREPVIGGELGFESATIDGLAAHEWLQRSAAELAALGATILTDTAIVSAAGGVAIAHTQPAGMPGADTLLRLYAPSLVNAMGAIERPIAFVDNDLPGIMLSGAAEKLLSGYGVRVGTDAVLFGNHDRLYRTALRLRAGGVRVKLIVDMRERTASAARPELLAAGVECVLGAALLSAEGRGAVRAVRIAPLGTARAGAVHAARRIDCDAVLVSGGWSPAVRAASAGGWQRVCGAAAGELTLAAIVGATDDDGEPHWEPCWRSPATATQEKRQFVDMQNDVTVADLRQALAEGFRDIEHVKRYTTLGVGTEQGGTGGVLGAAIVAELSGTALAAVGTSRARGPYQPVPMGVLSGLKVGEGLRPERRTSLHDVHIAAGAVLELMGGWMRPRYYRDNGADAFAAALVEAARVRAQGGICDASTLGKLEIAGTDAAAFLDRMYLNSATAIEPGRARYAALLREDGMVLDDGLLLRQAADRFTATTSSSHTAHVLAHLEFHRDTEWRGRRVAISDVTECRSVIICAGPRSREVLQRVMGAQHTPPMAPMAQRPLVPWPERLAALRHMEFVEDWCGTGRVRVLRASFSGELGFELHCDPCIANELWQALAAAGLAPFGLEALDILRVEKGYLTSSELNGQTSPLDAGLDTMLRASRDGTVRNSVGRMLLERDAFRAPQRPILVGLRAADGKAKFLGGAQITAGPADRQSLGYVTSAVFSPSLQEWIGLALVARHSSTVGTELHARDPLRSADARVRVVPIVHVDPEGLRMKA
jgi:glycine cleavage system aminomethyltransferase T/NADPH-dependent 2,4-dienoyl-CoA reductase/sulfur reductase-like enzyme